MAEIFYDQDADLSLIQSKKVGILVVEDLCHGCSLLE